MPLTLSTCTDDGCVGEANSVVLDANWRWTHETKVAKNCFTDSEWDTTLCDTPEDCAKNCALEGVPTSDWETTYGVTSDGATVNLGYVTGNNFGSRMYMLENSTNYRLFKMLNREFSFEVDVSELPCGLNGALYFSEMSADGGKSEFTNDNAGAQYGTGYCDAQCPQDVKFINGEANTLDWNTTTAKGKYGSCCAEMDIWEANSMATAFTAHPCSLDGPKRCETTDDCGSSGYCDKPGCDLNTYRFGDASFFGSGSSFSVDTSQKFTVVTQFVTSDNTDTGDLVDIRRFYVQNGKTIQSPKLDFEGGEYDSITEDFCVANKNWTGDANDFDVRGGLKQMGKALGRGMVLVLSIWDDYAAHMLWLDSTYPVGQDGPGAARGPCATTSGDPSDCRSKYPSSAVSYGNIMIGTIGSTTKFSPVVEKTTTEAPSSNYQCCYGGCSGSCQDGYCGQSQTTCEGSCSGQWCPALTESLI